MIRKLLILSLLPLIAIAEAPRRGTLSDGRAYRVDENGNQLVDYIAELEVNIDSLERRIYGLEDQLKEKNLLVDRLRLGQSEEMQINEKDLLKANQPAVISPESFKVNSELQNEQNTIKSKLLEVQAALVKEQDIHRRDIAFYQEEISKSRSGSDVCVQDLAVQKRKLDETTQELLTAKQQVQNLEKKAVSVDQVNALAIKDRDGEIEALRSKVATLQDSLKGRDYRAEIRPIPATITSEGGGIASQKLTLSGSNHNTSSRERAFESARGVVSSELAQLRMNVATRDSLFSQYDQHGKAMQIKPSKAVSRRGLDVISISEQLKRAATFKQLADLRQDIKDISTHVSDDTNLVRRLNKKG